MVRKTKDPLHVELRELLAGMIGRNEDVTARAVARLHSSVKSASDFTRHVERRALLEEAQARQQELRSFVGKVRHDGTRAIAEKLQCAAGRIRELEANEAARVASHLAMINAVAELGGTAKLLAFYRSYADIRDRLHRQSALPPLFVGTNRTRNKP